MNTQEKAKWLADFYQKVVDGGEIENLRGGKWEGSLIGPRLSSDRTDWRIKPKPRECYVYYPTDTRLDPVIVEAGFTLVRPGEVVRMLEAGE